MSSPSKRNTLGSPKKGRPSTAVTHSFSPKKSMGSVAISQIQIISELNGQDIKSQDKDIEIERLQTTCFNLNNKVSVTEDLLQECEILKRRLAESENIRNIQKEEIANYEKTRL